MTHRRFFHTPIRMAALICLLGLSFLLCGCPEKIEDTSEDTRDINGPQAPLKFTARAFFNRVELRWELPDEYDGRINKDIRGVLIVRAENERPLASPYRGDTFEPGDELGRGKIIYIGGEEGFIDEDVAPGTTYYYETFSFDEVPNYGESDVINATPGSMIRARLAHSQTIMNDGQVLVVGGVGFAGTLEDAEIYDPEVGVFNEVVSEMRTNRFDHSATLLQDGRVLILGGYEEGFLDTLNTAEIFDPETLQFQYLDARMNFGRASHTATLLDDGTLLIVGGTDGYNGYDTAEIFDPETESFTLVQAKMVRERYDHTATLVQIDGAPYVLIAGGFDGFDTVPYATFFDPASQVFTDFAGEKDAEDPMDQGRLAHTATLIDDGSVVIVGGFVGTLEAGDPTMITEVFAPNANPVFRLGGSLNQARSGHEAVLLDDGRLLVIGGINADLDILGSVESYDTSSDAFTELTELNFARTVPKALRLADGQVLVTGGNESSLLFDPEPLSIAELFDPATDSFSVIGQ